MTILSERSKQPEELDDGTVDTATYNRVLAELAVINRLTVTHGPTLRWLARATKDLPVGATFSALDVGYGHGDLLRAIARWARRRGLHARLSGIDLNPRSAVAAREATPEGMSIDYRTGDVFSYTPSEPVDFIVSSQFAHHLSGQELVEFLAWIDRTAVRGWHIADLHRHALAYCCFPVLATLAGWHRITRCDGAISIARSFRRQEWRSYLDAANVLADVSWHLPFRLCVSRDKTTYATVIEKEQSSPVPVRR